MIGVHADTKAHPKHAFLAWGQAGEHPRHGFLQIGLDCGIDGNDGVLVFNEIAQVRIFLIADWRFKADRLFGDFHYLAHFFERHRQAFSHFLRRRLAALLVQELATGAH